MSENNNGRDANGRFVKGNPGGPGNPFARQMASFRQRLMDAVTPDDFEAIAFQLVLLARGGNLDAVKLLFSYIMGKPTNTVDPDRLDHQEFEMHKNGGTTVEDIEKVLDNMPMKNAVEFTRVSKEAFYDRQVEVGEEKRRRRAAKRERRMEQRRFREEQLRPQYDGWSLEEEMGLNDEQPRVDEGMVTELMEKFKARFKEEFAHEFPSKEGAPMSNGGAVDEGMVTELMEKFKTRFKEKFAHEFPSPEKAPSSNGETAPMSNGESVGMSIGAG